MNYTYSLKLAVRGNDDNGDSVGAGLDVDIDQDNMIHLSTTDEDGTLTYSNGTLEELREIVTRVMSDLTALRTFLIMMEDMKQITATDTKVVH